MIALHRISDSLPIAPTIEATSEEPGPPVSLPAGQASTSGLRRPHEQPSPTPTRESSEEEDVEGAVGGVFPISDDQETEGEGRTTRSDVTSSY